MKKFILLFAFVALCASASAQMAKFQALYVYNFAKNVGWAQQDASKDLVVTIIGDNDLTQELATLSKTKKIGARAVVVNSAATASGLPKSDIVILGESKSAQMSQLLQNQEGNAVLIVSCKKGMCASGAGISFLSEGSKLQFEISEKNIKKYGLSVSQKLVALGISVN